VALDGGAATTTSRTHQQQQQQSHKREATSISNNNNNSSDHHHHVRSSATSTTEAIIIIMCVHLQQQQRSQKRKATFISLSRLYPALTPISNRRTTRNARRGATGPGWRSSEGGAKSRAIMNSSDNNMAPRLWRRWCGILVLVCGIVLLDSFLSQQQQ
jgi:hypothetical protein